MVFKLCSGKTFCGGMTEFYNFKIDCHFETFSHFEKIFLRGQSIFLIYMCSKFQINPSRDIWVIYPADTFIWKVFDFFPEKWLSFMVIRSKFWKKKFSAYFCLKRKMRKKNKILVIFLTETYPLFTKWTPECYLLCAKWLFTVSLWLSWAYPLS